MSQPPLPDGWIQEYDPQQKHPFWVDTTADPPRAIWVHPYEDEQFLSENPGIKAKVEKLRAPLADPPPYEKRRHSFSAGETAASLHADAMSSGSAGSPPIDEHQEERKRGMFGKLKDKAIGTKEEREAHKKQKAEERARDEELRREARRRNLEQRAAYMQQNGGYPPYGYGYPGYSGGGYGPSQYGPPAGDPYAYNDGRYGRGSRRGGFGGGMALPLLGGLAGGLLLGDMLDGGFGGGGFGGGGFDGGFGGGGFF
ncbi:hypothetical protein DFJ58DRAFT_903293 [Suillus subalutaceus]|uniref:uncharacterized protein n=1 Tax=Suillus subalutaceus TaxID=48586 RepID=UPI001B886328|nr:uncharacterized protein DFJ58DRAFT_903293 [Suillus subalutaceus]KAG1875606.1 hypothetical protein DFJ58DRAFT_903293 [Suillus subalutaceus]